MKNEEYEQSRKFILEDMKRELDALPENQTSVTRGQDAPSGANPFADITLKYHKQLRELREKYNTD